MENSSITANRVQAAATIHDWWTRTKLLLTVRSKLLQNRHLWNAMLLTISKCKLHSFEVAQKEVANETFLSALSYFLHTLPKDTGSRNVRLISSSVFIGLFPDAVFAEESSDQLAEVVHLSRSSAAFLKSLTTLLSEICKTESISLRKFRRSLMFFRISLRNFVHDFGEWKRKDSVRLLESLQDDYLKFYVALLGQRTESISAAQPPHTEFALANPDAPLPVEALRAKLEHIHQTLVAVAGASNAAAIVEELTARANSDANNAEVSAARPPLLLGSAAVEELSPTARDQLIRPSGGLSTDEDTTESKASKTGKEAEGPVQFLSNLAQSRSNARELTSKESKLLEQLTVLSGIGNERLVYEVLVDPSFQLPTSAVASTEAEEMDRLRSAPLGETYWSTLVTPSQEAQRIPLIELAALFQRGMLRILSDRLVNSLLQSPILSYDQLAVGMTVPVRFGPDSILSARILGIVSREKDDLATEESVSSSASTIDVDFLCDGTREFGLAVQRVVLHLTPPDPRILLSAIDDLLSRLAALTPSRPDLHQKLMQSVDRQLAYQMIIQRAINPSELLRLLQVPFQALIELQSPAQAEVLNRWWCVFESVCLQRGSNKTGNSIQDIIPLLPLFFEYCARNIDALQRDIANYYLSALVPVLQQIGAEYVAGKFIERAKNDVHAMDNAISFFSHLISDQSARQTAHDQLVEALDLDPAEPNELVNTDALLTHDATRGYYSALMLFQLLQSPLRLDQSNDAVRRFLPETFVWDAKRLASIRDGMDRVAIVSAVTVCLKQILRNNVIGGPITPTSEDVESFQTRLFAILQAPDVDRASIIAEVSRCIQQIIQSKNRRLVQNASSFSKIVEQCRPESRSNAPSIGSPRTSSPRPQSLTLIAANADLEGYVTEQERHIGHLSYTMVSLKIGWETDVHNSISQLFQEGNAVYSLFFKRTGKILLRGLLERPFQVKLSSFSMQSKAIEDHMSDLIRSGVKILLVNSKVFREVYKSLYSFCVSRASAPDV